MILGAGVTLMKQIESSYILIEFTFSWEALETN